MSGLSNEQLQDIVAACEAGTATPVDMLAVAGLLRPCIVILSQLTEPILQALMFEDPKDLELLNLILMTKHGVMTIHDLPGDTMH